MFHQLVSHNPDIGWLIDKGYAVAFDDGYLVIRDIPYLDGSLGLQLGAFVAKLVYQDKVHVAQDDHQVFFAGGSPHGLDGKPIPNLADRATKLTLSSACSDVVVQRQFSNKPKKAGKFADFFEKIESYANIISGPAEEKHDVSRYTFRCDETMPDSVFKFRDTLSSRAEIGDLSARLKNDIVAIIGLGGTGAYVLDFLVRTPVREIRGFDPDIYHVHTAFRSPGATSESDFGRLKTEVYAERYRNFRVGLTLSPKFIDASCVADLASVTFAFVCVDKGPARAGIFDLLLAQGIPFIDVGMGLNRKRDALNGRLRVTYFSQSDREHVRGMQLAEETDGDAAEYRANIQIGELNSLNACLAVNKFKQLRGFYLAEKDYFHMLFKVGATKIIGEAVSIEN